MDITYRDGKIEDCLRLADNKDAQRLYQRVGFEIDSHIEMDSHELIPHEGGAYLMKCSCD